MNRNPAATAFFVIMAALMGGLLIVMTILMSSGNVLGQFFKFLLATLFLFGVIFPKPGFYTLVVACGYFDLLKRLLVVADRVTYDDLTYVLGCPPALLGGVLLGLAGQFINGKRSMRPWNWFCLLMVPVICGAVYGHAKLAGLPTKDAAQETINAGYYASLLVVVPLLFPHAAELRKTLRFTIWAYLPVAAYGIWQKVFGLAEFEITYLKTGMTILISHLIMGELRPFSTLNSPTALGAVCAAMAALCLLDRWHTPPEERRSSRRLLSILLGIVYVGGLIASTSRCDITILVAALVCASLFMTRIKTNAAYFTATAAFVALVLASQYILDSIERLQYFLWSFTGTSEDQFANQMTRLGTYSDRLMGFSALSNDSRVWTLFGASKMVQESVHFHDPLTSLLLTFGSVPLFFGGCICIALLSRIHRRIWEIEDQADRRLASLCLATALGMVAASLLGGSRLNVFPVGLHFWLLLGAATSVAWQIRPEPLAAPEDTVATATESHEPPRRRGGRFRPVAVAQPQVTP